MSGLRRNKYQRRHRNDSPMPFDRQPGAIAEDEELSSEPMPFSGQPGSHEVAYDQGYGGPSVVPEKAIDWVGLSRLTESHNYV